MAGDLKTIRPSQSYSIRIPIDAVEQADDTVTSLWIRGNPLLLQLSSYIRSTGEPIGAIERLQQRMSRSPGIWRLIATRPHAGPGVDQAVAEVVDDDGINWIHIYLVWPHLTIYAVVSWPELSSDTATNWALEAISTIMLVQH